MIFPSVRHTDRAGSGERNINAFQSRRTAAPVLRNEGHNSFTMTQYKKLYAEYYGITWDPKEMEVHHIDCNRENNDIFNLILLPKKMHHLLHKRLREVVRMGCYFPTTEGLVKEISREGLIVGLNLAGDTIEKYLEVLYACSNWCLLKRVGYHTPAGEHIAHITPTTYIL